MRLTYSGLAKALSFTFLFEAVMVISTGSFAQEAPRPCDASADSVSVQDAVALARQSVRLHQEAEATCWFRKAAELGDVASAFSLGMRYVEGRGTDRNKTEGERWLAKAEQLGFAPAAGYRICSQPKAQAAMLRLKLACLATPAMRAVYSLMEMHCGEKQSITGIIDLDIAYNSKNPSQYLCNILFSAHLQRENDDTLEPLDCQYTDLTSAAKIATASFSVDKEANDNIKLTVHDADAESIGACQNMSETIAPN